MLSHASFPFRSFRASGQRLVFLPTAPMPSSWLCSQATTPSSRLYWLPLVCILMNSVCGRHMPPESCSNCGSHLSLPRPPPPHRTTSMWECSTTERITRCPYQHASQSRTLPLSLTLTPAGRQQSITAEKTLYQAHLRTYLHQHLCAYVLGCALYEPSRRKCRACYLPTQASRRPASSCTSNTA